MPLPQPLARVTKRKTAVGKRDEVQSRAQSLSQLHMSRMVSVRAPWRGKASGGRSSTPKASVREVLEDGEDVEGILCRERLRSKANRIRYDDLTWKSRRDMKLTIDSEPARLDAALNCSLAFGYLGGESVCLTSDLYYAVRWEFALGSQFLRLSFAAMRGDLTTEPSRMQKAETWESCTTQ